MMVAQEEIQAVPLTGPVTGEASPRSPRPHALQVFADSADLDLAAKIAGALTDAGHEVVGGAFDPERVAAVVVIWSRASLASPAMLAAARAAQAARPILPVSVGAVSAPPDFPYPEPAPLDDWRGDAADPRWQFLLDEAHVATRRGLRGAPPPAAAAEIPAPRQDRATWIRGLSAEALRLGLFAASALVIAIVLGALPIAPRSSAPRVAAIAQPKDNVAAAAKTPAAPAPPVLGEAPPPDVGTPVLATLTSLVPQKPSTPAPTRLASVDTVARLIVHSTEGGIFSDCAFCPPLTRVSAGRATDAKAGRAVTLAKPFALGAYEVTFKEWDACVADGGCGAYRPRDAGWGRGARPVIHVSFADAAAYVAWLSAKTGHAYRLPTNEEWTYAAASGGARPDPKGAATRPVEAGAKDARGATDLLGNVWEWTADCADVTAAGVCRARVVKGGAWNTGAWRRTPFHFHTAPAAQRDYDLGFRVARDL